MGTWMIYALLLRMVIIFFNFYWHFSEFVKNLNRQVRVRGSV
jgi:hypothetical protein